MIHPIFGINLELPTSDLGPESKKILLGMGCFWGAERLFWNLPGIKLTAVGYSGGDTKNPSYESVCSGITGHAEVVLAVYDEKEIPLNEVLKCFWVNHDPTQLNRQGNDIGTQYRSCIYVYNEDQRLCAVTSKEKYQEHLDKAGLGTIRTEIQKVSEFYYAEEYHQQYLHKNPNGYCGLKGTGVKFDKL